MIPTDRIGGHKEGPPQMHATQDTSAAPRARRRKAEGAFTFIEILVVMGIIAVLVSMVVVVIPKIQETARQTKSTDNVSSLLKFMQIRVNKAGMNWKPFPYNGKNFVLAVVAYGDLDPDNKDNAEILFSPGDGALGLEGMTDEEYEVLKELKGNRDQLKTQDFGMYTSYAGRMNAPRFSPISSAEMNRNTMVICDDDMGPLHHPGGIITGWSNLKARYMEWEELDIPEPEDPEIEYNFLGSESPNTELQKMSSESPGR